MKYLAIVFLAFLLVACASGYSQFYTAVPGATPDVIAKIRAAPPPQMPALERTPRPSNLDQYTRRGYAPIGYSFFNSGQTESETSAIDQGQKVGADLVVVFSPSYTGSVTSEVPITTPRTSTAYTSGSATAYGPGGSVTAYGNSTTTTSSNETTYIPFTVNRFNYGAIYFVKRHYILGVNWRDLTNEERAVLQSNAGVYITSVVNDTPAFRDNILVSDIILKIDGQAVYGEQAATAAVEQKRGQDIRLTILRNGQIIEKMIKLSQ